MSIEKQIIKRNEYAYAISDGVGLPDDLEEDLLRILDLAKRDKNIGESQYNALSNDIYDAKALLRIARRILTQVAADLIPLQ